MAKSKGEEKPSPKRLPKKTTKNPKILQKVTAGNPEDDATETWTEAANQKSTHTYDPQPAFRTTSHTEAHPETLPDDLPTLPYQSSSSAAAEAEPGEPLSVAVPNNIPNRYGAHLYVLGVAGAVALIFAIYSVASFRENRGAQVQQQLQDTIGMFSTSPTDYQSSNRDEFDYRKIAGLFLGVLGSLVVMKLRRTRHLMHQRREALVVRTCAAVVALVGLSGAGYVFLTKPEEPIMSAAQRDPTARGLLYLGTVGVMSMGLLAFRVRSRRTKKHLKLEQWRKKKHAESWKNARNDGIAAK